MSEPTRIGDWTVEARLGVGGSGTVYRVRRQDQVCALKLLHRQALTAATRTRFAHEFALLTTLDHPGIVRVVEKVENGDTLAIVSELAEGVTLETHLTGVEQRGLPVGEVYSLLLLLCEGLEFLHTAGILHRDLKPANIMVNHQTPRILDFGLSRLMGEETIVTDPKRIKVTLAYTAPEIILREPTGPPTDLYALGHILYQMLTGRAAFARKSLAALATAHIAEPPPRPGAHVPGLSHWWDEITAKLLQKKAKERYPTARALRDDLLALRGELGLEA